MTSDYISAKLRKLVQERANKRACILFASSRFFYLHT